MKKSFKQINTCVSVYLSPEECAQLRERMEATTCRNKSEFLRKIILGKPLRVLQHNESIDNMIEELAGLRRELERLLDKETLTEGERVALSSIVKQIKETIIKLADYVCKSKI